MSVTVIKLRLIQLEAVTWKNVKIYYNEAPVLIFGVLFPFFIFLAFALGREVGIGQLIPGLLGITIFFTGSSVGPFITPWETRTRTLERLISTPAPFYLIILGDIMAGFFFGLLLSTILVIAGVLGLGLEIRTISLLFLTIILGSFCFASLGSLFSALPTDKPANVMMLSNLVRLPLLFISGVFVPLTEMPVWAQRIAYMSPLSYIVDLLRYSFGGENYFALWFNLLITVFFAALILFVAISWHQRSLLKRI